MRLFVRSWSPTIFLWLFCKQYQILLSLVVHAQGSVWVWMRNPMRITLTSLRNFMKFWAPGFWEVSWTCAFVGDGKFQSRRGSSCHHGLQAPGGNWSRLWARDLGAQQRGEGDCYHLRCPKWGTLENEASVWIWYAYIPATLILCFSFFFWLLDCGLEFVVETSHLRIT